MSLVLAHSSRADLLLGLKEDVSTTVLPRDREKARHYGQPRFKGIRVAAGALQIAEIAPACDLFSGAGGTISRFRPGRGS